MEKTKSQTDLKFKISAEILRTSKGYRLWRKLYHKFIYSSEYQQRHGETE
jgi:hypothetical protein